MYTEIHNWKDFEQKVLYFKLNNVLNLQEHNELNRKFAGIYAIFKDNICLYVGQSINLASRIATHLKGKYETATEIYLWNVENIGFSDFHKRNKDSQKGILDNCEKYLMSKLQPIENLLIDMSFEINKEETPSIDFDESSCFSIFINDYDDLLRIKNYDYTNMTVSDILNDFIDLYHKKNIIKQNSETKDIFDEVMNIIISKEFDFSSKSIKND